MSTSWRLLAATNLQCKAKQGWQCMLPSVQHPHERCRGRYWGDAVVWGDKNLQPSAAACCDACAKYKPATNEEFSCNGGT